MKKYLLSLTVLIAIGAQADAQNKLQKSYNETMLVCDSIELEQTGLKLQIRDGQQHGKLVVIASNQCTLTIIEGIQNGDIQTLDSMTLVGNRNLVFGAQQVLARQNSSPLGSRLFDIFVRLEIDDTLRAITSIECQIGQSADNHEILEIKINRGDFNKKLTAAVILQAFPGTRARIYTK